MLKFKIITCPNTWDDTGKYIREELESQVNRWLKGSPRIEVIAMSYSEIPSDKNSPRLHSASVAIMYKIQEE